VYDIGMMQSSQTLTLNLVGLEKSEVAVGNAVVEHVKFFPLIVMFR